LVIAEDGASLGVMTLDQAHEVARTRNLDLVEVSSTSDPPVCRLLDYDHFRYEQSRKEREVRKTQKSNLLSEVRLRPKIGQHDIDYKTRKIREFLDEGDKVRINVRFRGREITHPELGALLLGRVAESLNDVGVVDSPPRLEGNSMVMVLAPGKAKAKVDEKSKVRVVTEDAQAKDA
jgi:translation initiation factor IF-3